MCPKFVCQLRLFWLHRCGIATCLIVSGIWGNVSQTYLSLASSWDVSRLGHFAECVRDLCARCGMLNCVVGCTGCVLCPKSICQLPHVRLCQDWTFCGMRPKVVFQWQHFRLCRNGSKFDQSIVTFWNCVENWTFCGMCPKHICQLRRDMFGCVSTLCGMNPNQFAHCELLVCRE